MLQSLPFLVYSYLVHGFESVCELIYELCPYYSVQILVIYNIVFFKNTPFL